MNEPLVYLGEQALATLRSLNEFYDTKSIDIFLGEAFVYVAIERIYLEKVFGRKITQEENQTLMSIRFRQKISGLHSLTEKLFNTHDLGGECLTYSRRSYEELEQIVKDIYMT